MIERLTPRFLLVLLGLSLVLPLRSAENQANSKDRQSASTSANREIKPITPDPADGKIAFIAARMLEQLNFVRQPLDNSVSSRFLDRYIETLDPQHIHFTQADLAEFEKYRTRLDDLTVNRRGAADLTPAVEIYNRFVERLKQRSDYAQQLLKNEEFTFETDDKIITDRDKMPYPKDLEEARKLWNERVRFEYLQELLAKIAAREKAAKDPSSAPPADPKKTEAEQIVDTLSHRYERNVKTFRDFDHDDVLQIYLTALAHVYDPHSDYMGRSQLEQFSIGMNLSLFGIGAELRSEDGFCTINRLLPGGPALKSGKIQEKDRIVAVAQSNQPPVDVVDMNLTKAVQLIRGPKGTEVRLTVVPHGGDTASQKIVTLIRDEIPLEDQAAKAKLFETTSPTGEPLRLGVIDLPSFYATFDPGNTRGKAESKSTTSDVARLIGKLKEEKINGLILDLRRNGGGSLEEAIRLTGLFIRKGPVVQVYDWEGNVQVEEDNDPSVAYDGPLVVLTSRFSASASEILAGALQDYGRALLVGDTSTHGKGTVQSVNSLRPYMQMLNRAYTNEPGALKVTIKKFYRASGASTQLKGVAPDIILPSVLSTSKDFGESSLDNPMPWDTREAAEFEYLNRVAPYLAELRKRSEQRVATDPDYQYIQQDIALFKKQQAEGALSLNLTQRLKDKAEADAREKARKQERLARGDKDEKVYEITLKLVDQPGLPAPVPKTNSVARVERPAVGVTGTNDLASTGSQSIPVPAKDAEDEEEDKAPAVDAPMLEAQRILIDYCSLLSKKDLASAPRTAAK
jgi:carboxyl-terminal processing protease